MNDLSLNFHSQAAIIRRETDLPTVKKSDLAAAKTMASAGKTISPPIPTETTLGVESDRNWNCVGFGTVPDGFAIGDEGNPVGNGCFPVELEANPIDEEDCARLPPGLEEGRRAFRWNWKKSSGRRRNFKRQNTSTFNLTLTKIKGVENFLHVVGH